MENTNSFSARFKKVVLKSYKTILNILGVAAFGVTVTACYGTPYGEYKIKGKVVDTDLNPINGIKVTLVPHYYNNLDKMDELRDENNYEVTTTRGDGTFEINDPYWSDSQTLYAIDVDGPENGGEFQSAKSDFEFVQVEAGDGNWYEGSQIANNILIVMKKKDANQAN